MPGFAPILPVIAGPSTSVYERLRGIARRHLARERCDHTLQATALVHEAYLRLSAQSQRVSGDSAQLLIAASGVMRVILVDHARRKQSEKRGGEWRRVESTLELSNDGLPDVDILAVNESLKRLKSLDPQLAGVVELRFFGGLSDSEIAEATKCSTRTVRRAWKVARAWLARDLAPD